jgi:hypothetical protein
MVLYDRYNAQIMIYQFNSILYYDDSGHQPIHHNKYKTYLHIITHNHKNQYCKFQKALFVKISPNLHFMLLKGVIRNLFSN